MEHLKVKLQPSHPDYTVLVRCWGYYSDWYLVTDTVYIAYGTVYNCCREAYKTEKGWVFVGEHNNRPVFCIRPSVETRSLK